MFQITVSEVFTVGPALLCSLIHKATRITVLLSSEKLMYLCFNLGQKCLHPFGSVRFLLPVSNELLIQMKEGRSISSWSGITLSAFQKSFTNDIKEEGIMKH